MQPVAQPPQPSRMGARTIRIKVRKLVGWDKESLTDEKYYSLLIKKSEHFTWKNFCCLRVCQYQCRNIEMWSLTNSSWPRGFQVWQQFAVANQYCLFPGKGMPLSPMFHSPKTTVKLMSCQQCHNLHCTHAASSFPSTWARIRLKPRTWNRSFNCAVGSFIHMRQTSRNRMQMTMYVMGDTLKCYSKNTWRLTSATGTLFYFSLTKFLHLSLVCKNDRLAQLSVLFFLSGRNHTPPTEPAETVHFADNLSAEDQQHYIKWENTDCVQKMQALALCSIHFISTPKSSGFGILYLVSSTLNTDTTVKVLPGFFPSFPPTSYLSGWITSNLLLDDSQLKLLKRRQKLAASDMTAGTHCSRLTLLF